MDEPDVPPLRDLFAALAMQALLQPFMESTDGRGQMCGQVAKYAYIMADVMLVERDKK